MVDIAVIKNNHAMWSRIGISVWNLDDIDWGCKFSFYMMCIINIKTNNLLGRQPDLHAKSKQV